MFNLSSTDGHTALCALEPRLKSANSNTLHRSGCPHHRFCTHSPIRIPFSHSHCTTVYLSSSRHHRLALTSRGLWREFIYIRDPHVGNVSVLFSVKFMIICSDISIVIGSRKFCKAQFTITMLLSVFQQLPRSFRYTPPWTPPLFWSSLGSRLQALRSYFPPQE